MACGPYTSCGAVGPWGFVLETGRPTIPDPTQWLDSAPCAAYFACHAEKSYFPGLDREIEPVWLGAARYFQFLTFIVQQHWSGTCCALWSPESIQEAKTFFEI